MKIPFNIPICTGQEINYIVDAIKHRKISGDGYYTKQCSEIMENAFSCQKVLLTTSCTHALEMAAILSEIHPGDEVIMPSFTFSSTANAFVLRGAKIVFVDIRPDTNNIDEKLIEQAITPKTKAVVPVHYAGVSAEMDEICEIAQKYGLIVTEDAAQGVNAFYKDKALGTLGSFGCYSFHETKNYSMGEGGAIAINNPEYNMRAEIIREKGTNRSQFARGFVDKYTWVDEGSSYLPGEINAAYLFAQLKEMDAINKARLGKYNRYKKQLTELENLGSIELPVVPENCRHNAHMFYIKTRTEQLRTSLIEFLKIRGITAVFHYVPLHSSPMGKKAGSFYGEDKHTTDVSQRLVRLPMYFELSFEEIDYVCECIWDFYKNISKREHT